MEINSALFQTKQVAQDFGSFGTWMSLRSGYKYAALRLNRYACFLQEIERQWRCVPEADSLVRSFGPEYMRRHRLFTQWLGEVHSLTVSTEAFRHAAESRQIQNLMDQLPANSSYRQLAEDYLRVLEQRHAAGRTSLRSVRLALTPAIALLKAAGHSILGQRHLNRYLEAKPGQRAALTGFISHLRKQHAYELTMPAKSSLPNQRKRIEKRLLELLETGVKSQTAKKEWIYLGLRYFHNVTARKAQKAVSGARQPALSQGINAHLEGKIYWLPAFPAPSDALSAGH
ncbi:hypothetical protein B9Q17_12375 [Marinobacter vinifirmus]|uniref:Uncharacterized protein n=1 Tax=Marinobacter vinifirmus TaxID=355591 RepID=A0A7Z1DW16_9GAMM|nr:hypothetical protein [Marinobacter vinifirmus]OZC35870.1 hypothetical protein B9Q17_12375 [Marinobacter vinifirmus]